MDSKQQKQAASNELSTAKSKQRRANNVEQTASDENQQRKGTGHKSAEKHVASKELFAGFFILESKYGVGSQWFSRGLEASRRPLFYANLKTNNKKSQIVTK